jgi:predicted ribosomally synthesized peptide with nif11-like leader
MPEEQLSAFLVAFKADTGLQEQFKGAADLDAAVAIAREAGFDVSKTELLDLIQAKQTVELIDEDLEGVTGGSLPAKEIAEAAEFFADCIQWFNDRVSKKKHDRPYW